MKRWNFNKKETVLFTLLPSIVLFVFSVTVSIVCFFSRKSFSAYVVLFVFAVLFAVLALVGVAVFALKFSKCAAQVVAIVLCVLTILPCALQITLQSIFWYNAMPSRTPEQIERIAYEQFHLEKIYFLDAENNGGGPWGDESYVLGERDGEEVLLIVGAKQGPGTAWEREWILSHSFADAVKKLNSTSAGIICTERDYSKFYIAADMEELMNIFPQGNYNLRNKFDGDGRFLVYKFAGKDLFIAEINGELHIYGEGFEKFEASDE
ncbi:MAG: hypothetical protein K2N74_06555 [Clostridiales bacterium]|nr:hypothetical protein [Clostridiales bacterium]